MRRAAVVLAVVVLLTGCTAMQETATRPAPKPAPTKGSKSPKPKASPHSKPKGKTKGKDKPKPVANAGGIKLYRVPESLRDKCRKIDRSTKFRLLCPTLFPQRSAKPVQRVTIRVLKDRKRFYGIEVGYSAPYERRPKKNRPDRFMHFLVMNGALDFGKPERRWKLIGRRKVGRQKGQLYEARGRSVHFEHYVFIFTRRGTAYAASLHRWDKKRQVLAVFERLVASLRSP